jgi:hypothetical protein
MTHNATLRLDETLYLRALAAATVNRQTTAAFVRDAITAAVDRAAESNRAFNRLSERLTVDEAHRG